MANATATSVALRGPEASAGSPRDGCKSSPTQDDSLVVSTNPILKKYANVTFGAFFQGFGVEIIKSLKFHQPEDYYNPFF